MAEHKGPPSRANERLSNLILEGGKSQQYRIVPFVPKDVPPAEAPPPSADETGPAPKS